MSFEVCLQYATHGVGGFGGAFGATSFSIGLRGMIFLLGGSGGGEGVGGGVGEGVGLSGLAARAAWSLAIRSSSCSTSSSSSSSSSSSI